MEPQTFVDENFTTALSFLEMIISQAGYDRENERDRRRALEIAKKSRADLFEGLSLEARLALLDHRSTAVSQFSQTMPQHQPSLYGFEAQRAKAAGGTEIYLEMKTIARREGIEVNHRSFDYLKQMAWKERPDLKPTVHNAESLHDAITALGHEKPYLSADQIIRMVSDQRPDLIATEYSRLQDDQRDAAERMHMSQEQNDVGAALATFTAEAAAWFATVGGDASTYEGRSRARLEYARAYPRRIPDLLRSQFQRGPRREE